MKTENRVVNIVNFIRGCEPRDASVDLLGTVKEEIKLNKEFGFDNTFLIQYNALINPDYSSLLISEKDDKTEIGCWLEMCEQLSTDAGIAWRGKYEWDWRVNPGFLPAYTQTERERIIDTYFKKFKEIFGEYPKSVGCWLIDSYSMEYMSKNYDIDAFCICREQYGTDGYTLWGGYYNGAYYPSKKNMILPAQTAEYTIDVPCFRMLGIDPADGYGDDHQKQHSICKGGCPTLEPVWEMGYTDKWIESYFENFCNNEDLGYSYTQTGQENSFDWVNFASGLRKQFKVIARLQKEGRLVVKKLGDSGVDFKKQFATTPATVYSTLDYAGDDGCKSIWYSGKNYRANLFLSNGSIRFRDIQLFDETFEEYHYSEPETDKDTFYFSYPVIDGRIWGNGSGIFFDKKGDITDVSELNGALKIDIAFMDKKTATLIMSENGIEISSDSDFALAYVYNDAKQLQEFGGDTVKYLQDGNAYELNVTEGDLITKTDKPMINSANGKITLKFKVVK